MLLQCCFTVTDIKLHAETLPGLAKKKHMPSYPCACSILSEGGQVGVQVKTRVYTAIMVPVSDYDNNETITENSFRMSDLCLT